MPLRYIFRMPAPVMLACNVCDRGFQHGPDRFEGRSIPAYEMIVCEPCWQANWGGWGPASEYRVTAHLAKKGISLPARNANGWIPRGE
jgi:hypothetical protein